MTAEPWFWPAVAVVVGLPVALLLLGELHAALVRRGSPAARPVVLVRNYLVPVGALLLLVAQVDEGDVTPDWTRVVATALGVLILVVALSGLDVALFGRPQPGSWRSRMPSIFVDLARIALVAVGVGVLFSWVWGADVGGLFAALGVTSIVLGLALQSAVGPVIAGLFLLFEQPFAIGDWIETGGVRGRVVEVNWRAAHIDTGRGVQIVPNGELAKASFTNLSRAPGPFPCTVAVAFHVGDPPHVVVRTLAATAADLPTLAPGSRPRVAALGAGRYEVVVPVLTPAQEGEARAAMLARTWYAARRAGLRLDGEGAPLDGPVQVRQAVDAVAGTLRLDAPDVERVAARSQLRRYATGEVVQRVGEVPDALLLVIEGRLTTVVELPAGERLAVGELEAGEYLGMSVLTRQAVTSGAVAATPATVLAVPAPLVDDLVGTRPSLARELGEAIDLRRQRARRALAAAGQVD